MQSSLQQRLVRYLKNHEGEWIAKAQLADLARSKMGVTGETSGRRLRVLAEVSLWGYRPTDTPEHRTGHELLAGGRVEVKQINGHSYYAYFPPATRQVRRVVVEGGVAMEVYETVRERPTIELYRVV